MPVYDCGDPLCEACRREFGPDRRSATEERKRRLLRCGSYQRSGAAIYTIDGLPVCFFSTERDAQMCITLMEAVAR